MTTPQVPAYLQKNTGISNFTDRLGSNLGTRAQPYLSIKDDRLTLVDATGNTRPVLTRDDKTGDPYIDCVIIDTCDHESKIYFGRPYDPKGDTFSPPVCWSDNGIAPSVNCSEPQASRCEQDPTLRTIPGLPGEGGNGGCKWACWGSGRAREGSKVVPPACAKIQKIALLIPGDNIQYLLRVPPNSLAEIANYNERFKGHAFAMPDVFTRISLRDKTLFFTGLGFIDEETAGLRDQVLSTRKTDALVGRGDRPRQAALPAPDPAWSAVSGTMPPARTAALPASAPAEQPGPLSAGNAAGTSTLPPPAAAPAATQSSAPTRRRSPGRPRNPVPAPSTNGSEAPPVSVSPTAAPFPHGMAQAPAPGADLEASLKSVFG